MGGVLYAVGGAHNVPHKLLDLSHQPVPYPTRFSRLFIFVGIQLTISDVVHA